MKHTFTGKIKGKRNCKIGKDPIRHHLMRLFNTIVTRCYDKNSKTYQRYGAKGIKICDEWLNDTNKFIDWALDNGFKLEKQANKYNKWTIDRIDNSKGYSPENCRWIDVCEQAKNKSTTYWVEYKGEKDTLMSFCRKLNMDYHAVYLRIKRRGWSVEKALSTPIINDYQIEYDGEAYNLQQLSRLLGVNAYSIKYQLTKRNNDIYEVIKYYKGKNNAGKNI